MYQGQSSLTSQSVSCFDLCICFTALNFGPPLLNRNLCCTVLQGLSMVPANYPRPRLCLYGQIIMTSGLVRNSLMIAGDLPCDYKGVFRNFNPWVPNIFAHSLLWTAAFALIIYRTMIKNCYFSSMSKSWYLKGSIDINFLAEFLKLKGPKIHFSIMIFSGFIAMCTLYSRGAGHVPVITLQ